MDRSRDGRGSTSSVPTAAYRRGPESPTRTPRRASLVTALGLERNIVAISAATFLLALGENLWKRFLPKYLESLGAPITAIGLFGTCEDLLDLPRSLG